MMKILLRARAALPHLAVSLVAMTSGFPAA